MLKNLVVEKFGRGKLSPFHYLPFVLVIRHFLNFFGFFRMFMMCDIDVLGYDGDWLGSDGKLASILPTVAFTTLVHATTTMSRYNYSLMVRLVSPYCNEGWATDVKYCWCRCWAGWGYVKTGTGRWFGQIVELVLWCVGKSNYLVCNEFVQKQWSGENCFGYCPCILVQVTELRLQARIVIFERCASSGGACV